MLGLHAPVLLLLDEPTAHLDLATEATVLRAIAERAAAGTTVVMVGHRNSVLAIADQVIVVEADHDVAVRFVTSHASPAAAPPPTVVLWAITLGALALAVRWDWPRCPPG